MSGTLIALIILTAIVGGYLIDYQKTRLKWMAKHGEIGENTQELRDQIAKLSRRVEHLEAIVTDEAFESRDTWSAESGSAGRNREAEANRMKMKSKN